MPSSMVIGDTNILSLNKYMKTMCDNQIQMNKNGKPRRNKSRRKSGDETKIA